jgi:hypothetical protein
MALPQVDLSNSIAGNSSLASDGPHEIADLHTIARSDGHEKACHSARSSGGPITLGRPWPGSRRSVLGSGAPLRSFALENVKRGGSELRGVELLE